MNALNLWTDGQSLSHTQTHAYPLFYGRMNEEQ